MSREGSMPVLLGALGCAAMLALFVGHGLAQQNATFNSYQVDDGWLKLPDGRRMGLATKVALDLDGRSLWVFDRCGAVDCVGSMLDPIAKFVPLGNLVVRFGAGMFNHPHGLHVDHDGNVWVTDDHGGGGKGHQVFKLSPQGKVLMTLGKSGIAGTGPDTFNAPTLPAGGDWPERLDHGEFVAMVEADLPFHERTARMLMAIGSDERIAKRKHVAALPPSWGTLYVPHQARRRAMGKGSRRRVDTPRYGTR
jgi:hypothetical protein